MRCVISYVEVYRIHNKVSGKSYIGVTKFDFKKRYNGNWAKFSHSKRLRDDAVKFGVDNFEVEILHNTATSEKELYDLEQLYIKQYNTLSPNGYNSPYCGTVTAPQDYELIDHAGNIYQVHNLYAFSKEHKVPYNSMLGLVCGGRKTTHGFALASSHIRHIPNPHDIFNLENFKTGESVKITRGERIAWALKRGLSPSKLSMMCRGGMLHYNGWKLKERQIRKCWLDGMQRYKNITLFDPQGNKHFIKDIRIFCEERGFLRWTFYDLINKRSQSAFGWSLIPPAERKKRLTEKLGVTVKLKEISTGITHTIKNIKSFARDRGLNFQGLYGVKLGLLKSSNGFCLPDTNLSKPNTKKIYTKISLKHRDGRIISAKNPQEIKKIFGLSHIYSMVNGRRKQSNGWSVLECQTL